MSEHHEGCCPNDGCECECEDDVHAVNLEKCCCECRACGKDEAA